MASAACRRHANARRSDFGSIRAAPDTLARHLRQRHTLWLHGALMGLLTVLATWAMSTALRHWGMHSLALRYGLALGVGYLIYLGLLRLWAGRLLRRREKDDDRFDGDPGLDWLDGSGATRSGDSWQGGGGGDFGGGGASGAFDTAGDGGALGDAASGALQAAAGADEGALVVIPVLAVFAIALAALLGVGSLLLLYFGSEALLAVALELAFAWTAARTTVRVEREGWLLAAPRLSWKPLLGALACAVLLGALVDHFAPQADTLPQAVQQWRAGR